MPKNHNREWSPEDVRDLRRFAKLKLPAREAAQRLGRGHPATRYKAMVEGIRFSSVRQPQGVQRRPAQRRRLSELAKKRARAS